MLQHFFIHVKTIMSNDGAESEFTRFIEIIKLFILFVIACTHEKSYWTFIGVRLGAHRHYCIISKIQNNASASCDRWSVHSVSFISLVFQRCASYNYQSIHT